MNMDRHYGIWTESDGGFCEHPDMTETEANTRLTELVAQDADNADDLRVVRACPDHADYADGSCPECEIDTCEGCGCKECECEEWTE